MTGFDSVRIRKWTIIAGICAFTVFGWISYGAWYSKNIGSAAGPADAPPRPLYLMSDAELLASCPPGHQAEFVFGGTSLFVDLRLFSHPPLQEIWARTDRNCPDPPQYALRGFGLYFSRGRELGRLQTERRISFRYLGIGSSRDRAPPSVPTEPAARRSFQDGSYAEDVTVRVSRTARIPIGTNHYRLQHAAAPDGVPPPILMSCSNPPDRIPTTWQRMCRTRYHYGPDLAVEYEFAVSRGSPLRQPPGTPNSSIAEPDGLFEFDARIRAWIDDLRRRP